MRVDLPAPLAPTRAWTSPAFAERSTPLSATTPGKRLARPLISSSGVTLLSITASAGTRPAARSPTSRPGPSHRRYLAISAGAIYADGTAVPRVTGSPLRMLRADLHRFLAGAGREGDCAALAVLCNPLQPAIVFVAWRHGDFAEAARLIESLGHADRHLAGRREDAIDLREPLQQVLGDLLGLGAVPVAIFGAQQVRQRGIP